MLSVFALTALLIKFLFYLTLLFLIVALAIRLWIEPIIKGQCTCTTKLLGKTVLIIGGNSGIGLETAKDLASRGARVIIASRNAQRSQKAVNHIIETTGNTNVDYMHLDLSKFSSIRQFAKDFNQKFDRLDILVNNAAAIAVEHRKTEDEINIVQQVNYLGPVLLTHLLLDKIITSKPSRIVNVSSYAHYLCSFDSNDIRGLRHGLFNFWFNYANSKLCQILWTKALAKRLPEKVTVNALHPGIFHTDIYNEIPILPRMVIHAVIFLFFKNIKEGAQTTIHLCVAPELESSTGGFYQDCKEANVSKLAQNEKLIETVWKRSLAVVEIPLF